MEVVYLVNSGSEANELAIRMARAATGRYGMACLENGYHGNTSTLIDVSHYKFAGPGGSGRRDWVTVLPSPDPYRNEAFRGSGARTAYMGETLHRLGRQPLEVAGLIAESLPGVAGQICPEPDVVTGYWELIRESGGVIIADEVQAGFGRVGEHFWSFDLFGGHPDIVTMGKPIGNGHPLGAVVATRRIAEAFDNGMEYFNTFGGNPVSAAVGNAVLDVIEEDGLQARALAVGARLKHLLAGLAADHEGIGDVRGAGLFLGIELVADRERKIPNPDLAKRIVESSKRDGVLLSVDGPDHNVIKIKPPMVFDDANSDRLVGVLDAAFRSVVV
jgi:4-aminobutyrate aminotransferase-like enzyme